MHVMRTRWPTINMRCTLPLGFTALLLITSALCQQHQDGQRRTILPPRFFGAFPPQQNTRQQEPGRFLTDSSNRNNQQTQPWFSSPTTRTFQNQRPPPFNTFQSSPQRPFFPPQQPPDNFQRHFTQSGQDGPVPTSTEAVFDDGSRSPGFNSSRFAPSRTPQRPFAQTPVPFFSSPPRRPFFQPQVDDRRPFGFGPTEESTERFPSSTGASTEHFNQGFSAETPSSSEFGSFDSFGRFHHPPPLRPPPEPFRPHVPIRSSFAQQRPSSNENFQFPTSFEENNNQHRQQQPPLRPTSSFRPQTPSREQFRPQTPSTEQFGPQPARETHFPQTSGNRFNQEQQRPQQFIHSPPDPQTFEEHSFQPSPLPQLETQTPQDITSAVSVISPGMSGLTDPRLRPQQFSPPPPPPPPPTTTTTTHNPPPPPPPPPRKTTVVTRRPTTTTPVNLPSRHEEVIFDQSPPTHSPVFEDVHQSLSASANTPIVGSLAQVCDLKSCQLPSCLCGGNKVIPGNLKASEVPQMVLLTFDDSVNDINYPFYQSILDKSGRKNPNGCPISATFYVSHEWTDYAKVQTLYAQGNEIASHSISHSDGAPFTEARWTNEIYGQKKILSALAGVPMDKIQGMRAPFLQGGGNTQFSMLYNTNFTYDSSMPAHASSPPLWPYSLDYHIPHDCTIPPCPRKSYPGVWEVPMCMWEDLKGGSCSMADACQNPSDARGVYDMMVKNFRRHYTTNRAPFGMFYHYAWFTTPHHKEGFLAFIDAILKLPDVFLVTNSQMMEWIRHPTPLSRINEFRPWACGQLEGRAGTGSQTCLKSHKCAYRFKGDERFFNTCQPCPEKYPWLENYDQLRVTV